MHDWQRAHQELLRLSREHARLALDEGHWLLVAVRSHVHTRLGYASFAEYIERLFGYAPRWTAEKLRVAAALETLPTLEHALGAADIAWSVARELTRVATPDTEATWLAAAHGKTARDVERLVSGHRPGSRPDEPSDPTAERHVLRFAVSAEVFAVLREAFARLRRDADGPLDDDAALLLMARHVLGPASDAGHSSYQIALSVCPACNRGTTLSRGEHVAVPSEIIEMAACDAQSFRLMARSATHMGHGERAKQSIPPATRRRVHHRDAGHCQIPGCRHAVFVDVHHIEPRADGGCHDPENLLTLCAAHHRAVHRGELVIRGRASVSLTFAHADGTPYGSRSASPKSAAASAQAFRALRSLGFREAESRRALARALTRVGHDPSAETLVRQALADLTPRPRSTPPAHGQVFDPKAA